MQRIRLRTEKAFCNEKNTIANRTMTRRSDMTTTPRTVRVRGPSDAISDCSATTTAGDWATMVTPSTAQTAATCSVVKP